MFWLSLIDGARVTVKQLLLVETYWNSCQIYLWFHKSYLEKHSLLVWRQYIYLLASNPRTIVMLWSTESHITFCLLYNLIHLTSIGDAAALLWSNGYCHMISGGGWWEWGNIQCTVGAYSWPGDEWSRSSVLERAYCPTSAQCPQVGAFRFSHQTLFFYEMQSPNSLLDVAE